MRAALLMACWTALLAGAEDRLSMVHAGLQQLSVDPSATFRVRDLELSEGGAKIYLSEGVLAFATPVAGKRIAAVYSTAPVEAGDGEVIAFPPLLAERASLARFTKSPNLDEHFGSALLFFASDTADHLLRQIQEHPLHPAPELASDLSTQFNESLRRSASEIEVRITQAILDRHSTANGFFYGMMAGRTLGVIDLIYQPGQPDSLVFGRLANRSGTEDSSYFQIWSAFRPRNVQEIAPLYQITDYHIDTTIHPDLSMTSIADFDYRADYDDGSVITLYLTPRMHVTSATIDGEPASVMVRNSPRTEEIRGATGLLLVNGSELVPASHHRVKLQYEGSVIRKTATGAYFVDDRNAWYPLTAPLLTVFDLTFHCLESLRLVATGEPVSETVENGQRTVHRRTSKAQALAGFNLGEFNVMVKEHPPYRIEICANPQDSAPPDLDEQAAKILKYYTERWMPLTGHSVSIAPIEGYFGQGFPGLIYLSSISYLKEKNRPIGLRNPSLDSFFSRLLLPHEMAHQWWGNVVTPADYHSNWILEAMSNYAALQYLEQSQGKQVLEEILRDYRADLIRNRRGDVLVDSYGPVTFDLRLENNFGVGVWHDILYEKGTWILHMLRQRMGLTGFRDFQLKILRDYALRPITNEDLRKEAAQFIPPNQPDRELTAFFDTWIYDTGIPELSVQANSVHLGGVADSFTVDVPLACGTATSWVRMNSGDWPLSSKKCGLPSVNEFLYKN